MPLIRKYVLPGIAACVAGAVAAQPYQIKAEVEGWTIYHNEANESCFMETVTSDGLIMQMGTGGKGVEMGYLALYTEGETDIQDGETGHIQVELGGLVYGGEAVGVEKEGYSGGYFIGNNPILGYDLSTQSSMIVNPNGEHTFTVDLTGAGAAFEATRACQAEISG